jgi:hypothetical protein
VHEITRQKRVIFLSERTIELVKSAARRAPDVRLKSFLKGVIALMHHLMLAKFEP